MTPTTIDEYISQFPDDIQKILTKIRKTIRKAAPKATEKISYRMPAFFKEGKVLVYFAAMKHHIGFYPTSEGIAAFADELGEYKTTKGAVQFPFSKPIPYELIARITAFRERGNLSEKTSHGGTEAQRGKEKRREQRE